MKAIIHVGMNKTGSSSIQHTFARLKSDRFHYVNWPAPNHSELFLLLFEDEDRLEAFHGFASRGETRADLLARRAVALSALQDELAAAPAPIVVFSGELISKSGYKNATRRLHEFFSNYCSDIKVIGYVRPPISFLTSAFQQKLKGGISHFDLHRVWPDYKEGFEKIDRVFGRENVSLKKFDPQSFAESDVVADFGHVIGIEPADVQRVNESLSLEAVALLFVQRRFGRGFIKGFHKAPRANWEFVEVLRGIGTTRFGLAAALVDPVLQANAADLAWMEARLGESLSDGPPSTGRLIGSEDELVALALENAGAVEKLLQGQPSLPGGDGALTRLVAGLEALYDLCVKDAVQSLGIKERQN